MSQSIPATQSPASTAVATQAALPVKRSFQLSTSEKVSSTINKLGYYPITGQVVGVLRTIYGVMKAALNLVAAFFAGYILCNPKKAAQFAAQYKDGLNQIKRGVIEFAFFGKCVYGQSDKRILDEKKAVFNKQTFKTEVLKEITAGVADRKQAITKEGFDKVVADLNTMAPTDLSHKKAPIEKEIAPLKEKIAAIRHKTDSQVAKIREEMHGFSDEIVAAKAKNASAKSEKLRIEDNFAILKLPVPADVVAELENEIAQTALVAANLESSNTPRIEEARLEIDSLQAQMDDRIQPLQDQVNALQAEINKLTAQEKNDLAPKARVALMKQHNQLRGVHTQVMKDIQILGKEVEANNKKIQKLKVVLLSETPLLDREKAQIVALLNAVIADHDKAKEANDAKMAKINKGLLVISEKHKAIELETLERANHNIGLEKAEVAKKIALVQSGAVSAQERKAIAKLINTQVNKTVIISANEVAVQEKITAEANIAAQDRYDALLNVYSNLRAKNLDNNEGTRDLLYILPTDVVTSFSSKEIEGFVKEVVANMAKMNLQALLNHATDEQVAKIATLLSTLTPDAREVLSNVQISALQNALYVELSAMKAKLGIVVQAVQPVAKKDVAVAKKDVAVDEKAEAPSLFLTLLSTVFGMPTKAATAAASPQDEAAEKARQVAINEEAAFQRAEEAAYQTAVNVFTENLLERLTKAAFYKVSSVEFNKINKRMNRELLELEGIQPTAGDFDKDEMSEIMGNAEADNAALDNRILDRAFANADAQVKLPELALSSLKRQAAPKADQDTQTV